MAEERLYLVAHDIADPKRWRRIFALMEGHGRWLQLSLFQCRLTARRRIAMAARLEAIVVRGEDHVLIVDLGPADRLDLRIESIGKGFERIERRAIVI
jgi:CRISPR-associated protein Cas2